MSVDTAGASLEIKANEPLKPYTTFKIGGPARFFAIVRSEQELRQALAFRESQSLDLFVLGGGSNILVSDGGFDGLVIHMDVRGIHVLEENEDKALLQCGAGETWDHVVDHAVAHGWWGLENLSHIPGQAGAALVQNIGAYGQQISDVLLSTQVMDIQSGKIKSLAAGECEMGYRRSLFNSTERNRFVILNSLLALSKHGQPNLGYPDLKAYFRNRPATTPGLSDIRRAVIQIRDSKFPFPREEKGGNAGSFFKNLTLNDTEFETLQLRIREGFGSTEYARLLEIRKKFPASDRIKVPTAFLLEICGLKGRELGGARVNETQPLVLLNMGGATASDVLGLAKAVRQTVLRRTGVSISLEPELVGFTPAEKENFLALE